MPTSRIPWLLVGAAALLAGGKARAGEFPARDLPGELESIERRWRNEGLARSLERLDKVIASLPPGERMRAWQRSHPRDRRLGRAWRVGRHACLIFDSDRSIHVFDCATGRDVAALPLERAGPSLDVWIAPVPGSREMLLSLPDRVTLVDPVDGEVRRAWEFRHDPRIAPVSFEGGIVLVPDPRGRSVVRLDDEGRQVWECSLPGYVMNHPAVYGSIMVIQTRGGSYGGQATSGVDLGSGELLWSERVNAYGCGAAFGDDAVFVVEADQWLSPGATEAWLICRDPKTGERLWEHRRPGFIGHRPLVETEGSRVYAVFDTGHVACFEGGTGVCAWETRLPARARTAHSASYHPYWPVLDLHEGRLIVLDANDYLHLLDARTGELRAKVALVSPVSADGTRTSYDEVVAMPWIEGGNLIVASKRSGLLAYPAARLLAGEESCELQARALRARLLLSGGRIDAARTVVEGLQAVRPESPIALDCAAQLYRSLGDAEREIIARLRMMRAQGAETDARLRELTGLMRRVPCGAGPTPPLFAAGKVFVGGADGVLRAYDAETLAPAGELGLPAGTGPSLALYDGVLVFPTLNRRVCGASRDLRLLFDLPAPNPSSLYVTLGQQLIRSSPYAGFVDIAVLDLERPGFALTIRVDNVGNFPVPNNGRLYYPSPGGGSASFDGQSVERFPPLIEVQQYRVTVEGDMRVAYGTGGVYSVDERMRPTELLAPSPTRAFAAASSRGALVALSEQRAAAAGWLLEGWTAAGAKLPLRYATPRYHPYLDCAPTLMPFGDGFLLVGRELAYVDAHAESPGWRFWPGGLRYADVPAFRRPTVAGDRVFATHADGDLYVFERSRIAPAAGAPAAALPLRAAHDRPFPGIGRGTGDARHSRDGP